MGLRTYYGGATDTTLSVGIGTGDTSFAVIAGGNLPNTGSGPFFAVIDPGQPSEEKILVGSVSGNTLSSISRGQDGTNAQPHGANAIVRHIGTATDLREANTHINTTTGVHGLAGSSSVVGTTDPQVLSGKTLVQPIITDLSNMQHAHLGGASGGTLSQGAVTGLTTALTGLTTLQAGVFKVFGVGAPVANTSAPPAAGNAAGFLVQGGTSVVTTNGNGDGNVTYPVAFPHGVLFFHVQSAVPPQHVTGYGDPLGTGPPQLVQFSFRAYSTPGGSVIAGSGVRVTWSAVGW